MLISDLLMKCHLSPSSQALQQGLGTPLCPLGASQVYFTFTTSAGAGGAAPGPFLFIRPTAPIPLDLAGAEIMFVSCWQMLLQAPALDVHNPMGLHSWRDV